MRAQMLQNYNDGLFSLQDLPVPTPGPGEVLIKIGASGVNPIDTKIRAGVAPYAMPDLPAILGTDLAGTVEMVGPGVSNFKPGDDVYGLVGGVRGMPGTLAEYVAVDAALLAPKPSTLSMREAAALPLVALTAWEGLVDRAGIQPGQKVLVLGGAGGVGHMAIQIALAHGAEVFATAFAGKMGIVRSLGATPIDRSTRVQDYVAQHTGGTGFDIVYDTVGGSALDDALLAARYYGHVASCAAFGATNLAPGSLRAVTVPERVSTSRAGRPRSDSRPHRLGQPSCNRGRWIL